MATIFGKRMSRQEICARVGSLSQIAGIRQYTFNSGRAKGVNAIEINTGSAAYGLLPSRCLDIAYASFRGLPYGYMSKSDIRGPEYFVENGDKGFLDNFFGGLLTTSGLGNIGASSVDQGRSYGMHGELANIPADETSVSTTWEEDECVFRVQASIRHSRFYGEDLLFSRKVETRLGESRIRIEDTVENQDFKPAAGMLLYHINFGYPLVDENTEFLTPAIVRTQPRTKKAAKGLGAFRELSTPVPGYEEECFYHWFEADSKGHAYASLYNPELDFSVYLIYDMDALPYFVQWKMMRTREYVFGLAPCNSWCEGRGDARERGLLPVIEPFEKRTYRLEIGAVEGRFDPEKHS